MATFYDYKQKPPENPLHLTQTNRYEEIPEVFVLEITDLKYLYLDYPNQFEYQQFQKKNQH